MHFAYYTSNNHRSEYVKFLSDKFRELGIGKYQKNMKDIFGKLGIVFCLNAFNSQMLEVDVKTYMIDFFVCKIMDVILLGFCSSRFMEIVGEVRSNIKYSKET